MGSFSHNCELVILLAIFFTPASLHHRLLIMSLNLCGTYICHRPKIVIAAAKIIFFNISFNTYMIFIVTPFLKHSVMSTSVPVCRAAEKLTPIQVSLYRVESTTMRLSSNWPTVVVSFINYLYLFLGRLRMLQ